MKLIPERCRNREAVKVQTRVNSEYFSFFYDGKSEVRENNMSLKFTLCLAVAIIMVLPQDSVHVFKCLAFELLLQQQTWTTGRIVNKKLIRITHFLFPFCGYRLIILSSHSVKCIKVPTAQSQIKEKDDKILPHQDGRLTAPYGVLKSPDWTMQRNERRLDALRKLIG